MFWRRFRRKKYVIPARIVKPERIEKVSNKYSDAMIAKMREIGSFDYNSAKAFADENGLSIRSVIAKLRALEINYQAKDPKQRKTATKSAARAKAEVISSIEALVGETLASLSKMTVADLQKLETRLAA